MAYSTTFFICATIGLFPLFLFILLKQKQTYRKQIMSIKIDPLIESVQVLHNEIETVFTQTPIATQALKI